jgi:catalase
MFPHSSFPQTLLQVMTFAQAAAYRFNPFDVTKTWPEAEFPLLPVGTLTLNRNPANYFEDIEQAAFAPARMVPGIEPSPDKMLQGRIFSYPDTQFHRLGPNFMKLPVNCPFRVNNTQINGAMRFDGNEGGAPVYHPNTFNGPAITGLPDSRWTILNTTVARFESGGEDNYVEPAIMWNTVG